VRSEAGSAVDLFSAVTRGGGGPVLQEQCHYVLQVGRNLSQVLREEQRQNAATFVSERSAGEETSCPVQHMTPTSSELIRCKSSALPPAPPLLTVRPLLLGRSN